MARIIETSPDAALVRGERKEMPFDRAIIEAAARAAASGKPATVTWWDRDHQLHTLRITVTGVVPSVWG
jgi:hypothetical protein